MHMDGALDVAIEVTSPSGYRQLRTALGAACASGALRSFVRRVLLLRGRNLFTFSFICM